MDKNFGDLVWDVRLKREQLKSDLRQIEADVDQTVNRIRQKFASVGGPGGGSGGPGAGGATGGGTGVPTPSYSAGASGAGYAAALYAGSYQSQPHLNQSLSLARSLLPSGMSYIGGPKTPAGVMAALNPLAGLLPGAPTAGAPTAGSLVLGAGTSGSSFGNGNMEPYYAEIRNRNARVAAMDNGTGGGGGGLNATPGGGNFTIPPAAGAGMSKFLKSLISPAIVTAIASELANESNYTRAKILAGGSGIGHAQADINAIKGRFGVLPFIGGALGDIATNARQTQVDFAQNDIEQSEGLISRGMMLPGARMSARMAGYSSLGYASAVSQSVLNNRQANVSISMAKDAAMKGIKNFYSDDPNTIYDRLAQENPEMLHKMMLMSGGQGGMSGIGLSDKNKQMLTTYAKGINDQLRAPINQQFSEFDKAQADKFKNEQAELKDQGKMLVAQGATSIAAAQLSNNFKPYSAVATSISGNAMATANAQISALGRMDAGDTKETQRTLIKQGLQGSIEDLKSQQKDIMMNFVMGRGQQFNPFENAISANQDVSQENAQQGMDKLTVAIGELTTKLQQVIDQK